MRRRDHDYDDYDGYERHRYGGASRRRHHRGMGFGAIVLTVLGLWLAAKALSGANGDAGVPTVQNPHPSYSAPCNQYFKGGC